MGTHPIFESDFDCLTEMTKKQNPLDVINKKISKFCLFINGSWQSQDYMSIDYSHDLGFIKFVKDKTEKPKKSENFGLKKDQDQPVVLLKFDHREKLTFGTLYNENKFMIQSKNYFVRFRIIQSEGKAKFMSFLKDTYEFDFKEGSKNDSNLAIHYHLGSPRIELGEMSMKSIYQAERVSNSLMVNKKDIRDHVIE